MLQIIYLRIMKHFGKGRNKLIYFYVYISKNIWRSFYTAGAYKITARNIDNEDKKKQNTHVCFMFNTYYSSRKNICGLFSNKP